jgi:hypothetical protein
VPWDWNNLLDPKKCSKVENANYSRPRIEGNHIMDRLTSSPGNAYDYVYSNFGMIGVIVAGLLVVVGAISVVFYFDRRK